jgi:hypothetical protein
MGKTQLKESLRQIPQLANEMTKERKATLEFWRTIFSHLLDEMETPRLVELEKHYRAGTPIFLEFGIELKVYDFAEHPQEKPPWKCE